MEGEEESGTVALGVQRPGRMGHLAFYGSICKSPVVFLTSRFD